MPTLVVRLTDAQMATVTGTAETAGVTISDYVRYRLFGSDTSTVPTPRPESARERAHRTHLILERAAHAKPRAAKP
jgi:hypothetical protein